MYRDSAPAGFERRKAGPRPRTDRKKSCKLRLESGGGIPARPGRRNGAYGDPAGQCGGPGSKTQVDAVLAPASSIRGSRSGDMAVRSSPILKRHSGACGARTRNDDTNYLDQTFLKQP